MAGTKKHSATKRRSTKASAPSSRTVTKRKTTSAAKRAGREAPMREGRLSKMSVAKAIEIAQRAGIIDEHGNLRAAYKHR